MLQTVQTALGLAAARARPRTSAPLTRDELDARYDFGDRWSAAIRRCCASCSWSAASPPTDASVLITGESGTGKELVAEAHPPQQPPGRPRRSSR